MVNQQNSQLIAGGYSGDRYSGDFWTRAAQNLQIKNAWERVGDGAFNTIVGGLDLSPTANVGLERTNAAKRRKTDRDDLNSYLSQQEGNLRTRLADTNEDLRRLVQNPPRKEHSKYKKQGQRGAWYPAYYQERLDDWQQEVNQLKNIDIPDMQNAISEFRNEKGRVLGFWEKATQYYTDNIAAIVGPNINPAAIEQVKQNINEALALKDERIIKQGKVEDVSFSNAPEATSGYASGTSLSAGSSIKKTPVYKSPGGSEKIPSKLKPEQPRILDEINRQLSRKFEPPITSWDELEDRLAGNRPPALANIPNVTSLAGRAETYRTIIKERDRLINQQDTIYAQELAKAQAAAKTEYTPGTYPDYSGETPSARDRRVQSEIDAAVAAAAAARRESGPNPRGGPSPEWIYDDPPIPSDPYQVGPKGITTPTREERIYLGKDPDGNDIFRNIQTSAGSSPSIYNPSYLQSSFSDIDLIEEGGVGISIPDPTSNFVPGTPAYDAARQQLDVQQAAKAATEAGRLPMGGGEGITGNIYGGEYIGPGGPVIPAGPGISGPGSGPTPQGTVLKGSEAEQLMQDFYGFSTIPTDDTVIPGPAGTAAAPSGAAGTVIPDTGTKVDTGNGTVTTDGGTVITGGGLDVPLPEIVGGDFKNVTLEVAEKALRDAVLRMINTPIGQDVRLEIGGLQSNEDLLIGDQLTILKDLQTSIINNRQQGIQTQMSEQQIRTNELAMVDATLSMHHRQLQLETNIAEADRQFELSKANLAMDVAQAEAENRQVSDRLLFDYQQAASDRDLANQRFDLEQQQFGFQQYQTEADIAEAERQYGLQRYESETQRAVAQQQLQQQKQQADRDFQVASERLNFDIAQARLTGRQADDRLVFDYQQAGQRAQEANQQLALQQYQLEVSQPFNVAARSILGGGPPPAMSPVTSPMMGQIPTQAPAMGQRPDPFANVGITPGTGPQASTPLTSEVDLPELPGGTSLPTAPWTSAGQTSQQVDPYAAFLQALPTDITEMERNIFIDPATGMQRDMPLVSFGAELGFDRPKNTEQFKQAFQNLIGKGMNPVDAARSLGMNLNQLNQIAAALMPSPTQSGGFNFGVGGQAVVPEQLSSLGFQVPQTAEFGKAQNIQEFFPETGMPTVAALNKLPSVAQQTLGAIGESVGKSPGDLLQAASDITPTTASATGLMERTVGRLKNNPARRN